MARNRCPEATYYIITADYSFVLPLKEEFKGLTEVIDIESDEFIQAYGRTTKKDILMEYIESRLEEGKWRMVKSAEVKKQLDIGRTTWVEIWKDNEFIDFCSENGIVETSIKGKRGKYLARQRGKNK